VLGDLLGAGGGCILIAREESLHERGVDRLQAENDVTTAALGEGEFVSRGRSFSSVVMAPK